MTNNAGQTQVAAKEILEAIGATERALVIALEGNLGAGKTTFTQGLGKELGIGEPILSPTFVIMKRYPVSGKKYKNLYHIDAYRLDGFNDMESILEKEVFDDPANLIVVEWAEKIKDILPSTTVWIKFEHLGEDHRKILISNF